jgi:hypothetical protein
LADEGGEHTRQRISLAALYMFYRPATELWPQMVDLLTCSDRAQDPESYGEILFMLGGNLGTLRGNYAEARQFLFRAIRHARQRRDHYILAWSLRKYQGFKL